MAAGLTSAPKTEKLSSGMTIPNPATKRLGRVIEMPMDTPLATAH